MTVRPSIKFYIYMVFEYKNEIRSIAWPFIKEIKESNLDFYKDINGNN